VAAPSTQDKQPSAPVLLRKTPIKKTKQRSRNSGCKFHPPRHGGDEQVAPSPTKTVEGWAGQSSPPKRGSSPRAAAVSATCRLHGSRLRSGCSADPCVCCSRATTLVPSPHFPTPSENGFSCEHRQCMPRGQRARPVCPFPRVLTSAAK
jgi:hypothetical protein